MQAVSGQSYETYIQQHILDPLQMRNSYTSQAEAEQHGLPAEHRYWYGLSRPNCRSIAAVWVPAASAPVHWT